MSHPLLLGALAASAAGVPAWRHVAPRSLWYLVAFPLKALRVYLTWTHVAASCSLSAKRRRWRWTLRVRSGRPPVPAVERQRRQLLDVHAGLESCPQYCVSPGPGRLAAGWSPVRPAACGGVALAERWRTGADRRALGWSLRRRAPAGSTPTASTVTTRSPTSASASL
jgi:hypothetical protein